MKTKEKKLQPITAERFERDGIIKLVDRSERA
jgi:hypothetical protein